MFSTIPTQLSFSRGNSHLYQQQSRIFAFSNAIASETDTTLLAGVLKAQLKSLFDINEYAILGLGLGFDPEKNAYTPLLYDIDASAAKTADVHDLLQKEAALKHAIDHILSSECPAFLTARTHGRYSSQLLGVPIRLGQENIGVMIFSHGNYDKMRKELCLFKSILSQITMVVCNIIARSKIKAQGAEISRYKKENISITHNNPINHNVGGNHNIGGNYDVGGNHDIGVNHDFAEMVGVCPPMQQIFRLIQQVASTDCTVLILGKTGTGKELVARAIHNHSPRRAKPMIKVNCAALPAHLIESELFGHERGSFTGATERRLGKFELAGGGTLFLDEIGEMPLDLQVKLLRVLQEREIERIGGKATIQVDVRIIAATNRELEKEMAEGRFRGDLYYRLNIFPITLPELKDRKEDIPLLASHFIARLAGKTGRKIRGISDGVLQDMLQYDWPGNIRELEHLIERSMLLSDGDILKQIQLPRQKFAIPIPPEKKGFIIRKMKENEKEYILNILQYCKGRVCGEQGAAEIMGIPSSTLFSKMKKLGIKRGF